MYTADTSTGTPDGQAIRVVDVGLLVHESLQEKRSLSPEEVPLAMRPILSELLSIGRIADEFSEEDDQIASPSSPRACDQADCFTVQAAANDSPDQPTRMDRLRWDLERGTNWDAADEGRASPGSTVRSLANRINRLALGGMLLSRCVVHAH